MAISIDEQVLLRFEFMSVCVGWGWGAGVVDILLHSTLLFAFEQWTNNGEWKVLFSQVIYLICLTLRWIALIVVIQPYVLQSMENEPKVK